MVVRYNSRKCTFTVSALDNIIETTVTASGNVVADWIGDTLHIHEHHLDRLIVGLDTEWCLPRHRSSNWDKARVAVLQLAVGRRCLVFQLLHCDYIPAELFNFFDDARFKFVGVGVADDAQKLRKEYDLDAQTVVELRDLAVEKTGSDELEHVGLKRMGEEIMGVTMEKPKRITLSDWGRPLLTYDQIKYAALDAYVSFEVGRRLTTGEFEYDATVIHIYNLP